jgi:TolB-like protein
MGKSLRITILIFLLLSLGVTVLAKEKSTVSVLPFSVYSAENIDYVQQGIWDMLASRISVSDKIEVTSKDVVLAGLKEMPKKDLTLADVYGLGKKMNVDFVVWGSITKIGNSVSIDAKLVDVSAYKSPVGIFAQSQGLDEIIPKINDFAQRISNHISGGDANFAASPATSFPVSEQLSTQMAREKELIAGMKASKKGTFTAIPIISDYINTSQGLDRKEFWISQQFGTELKGMDIGDVNNDGLNEVIVIDSNNVMIYQKKGTALSLLKQIPGKKHLNYIAVDIADINGNGIKEIYVTSINRNNLESFVLEWKGDNFTTIALNLPWFLRAVPDSTGALLLLGQRMGTDLPFNSLIREIDWDGTRYKDGKKMRIPEGISVYGLALDVLESKGTEKVIAFDEDDYLNIYDKTEKPLSKIKIIGGSKELIWKSDDAFGGSNNIINPDMQTKNKDGEEVGYFANVRILTYDTNKDGKKEIIVVKNLSSLGRVFKNTKSFTASEIYNLEWDGLGLAENWRTKKINGYVADFQFKDIDNDGQNEIVLALVLSVGISFQEKSVIVAYKLIAQEGTTIRQ